MDRPRLVAPAENPPYERGPRLIRPAARAGLRRSVPSKNALHLERVVLAQLGGGHMHPRALQEVIHCEDCRLLRA
jgi:hypothetical protein